ncbi:dienelactone hydrolase family protein [Cryobacterium aureum]|uniref:dienelactone hydrolase family protein n=1 Tax=Cryobacterium aureum TaxID=995037 RepID=UPI000CF56A2A|nr:dienelactone hydrolase family protein [Cryobacterium aureum]
MQPIPNRSDHSRAIKVARAGGVPLTVSLPEGTARAGVIVLHEVWGLSVPVADLVVRLAGCGYIAAAPHLYHRIDDPVVTDGKFAQARRYHDTLTTEGVTCDIESALVWIRAQGARKVAIIGFSMGGTLALWAAATLHIDAAVTFYGASLASPRWPGILSGIDAARALKAPWLGIYAGKDASTPARDIQQMREILTHTTTRSAVVVYPKVRHGFALDPNLPRHASDETTDAFERTALFLKTHLG